MSDTELKAFVARLAGDPALAEGLCRAVAAFAAIVAPVGAQQPFVVIRGGRVFDPASGAARRSREVITLIDRDHYTFEWFEPGPDGDVQRQRIEYTRIR